MKPDVARRAEIVRANVEKLAAIPQERFEDFDADFRGDLDAALRRLSA